MKSAALARLSGAARVIGFDRARAARARRRAVLHRARARCGEGRHVIDKNLRLAAAVGARRRTRSSFRSSTVESRGARRDSRGSGVERVRAAQSRRGVAEQALAARPLRPMSRAGCATGTGCASVVLCGARARRRWPTTSSAASAGAARRGAADGDLPDLVALCARARALMVSGDTGPTHIAAAVGTPVVALFGPTNPRRNGPWDADDVVDLAVRRVRLSLRAPLPTSADTWCLGTIATDEVERPSNVC